MADICGSVAAVRHFTECKRWHKKKKRVNERGSEGIGNKARALMKLLLCVYVSCPSKQSTLAEEDRC